MGAGSSVSQDNRDADYATRCVNVGIQLRDVRQYESALKWLLEAYRVRERLFFGIRGQAGPGTASEGRYLAWSAEAINYNEAYVSVMVQVAEVYFWNQQYEQALAYFFKARRVLQPFLSRQEAKRSTVAVQLVNMTAGIVLLCLALATSPPAADADDDDRRTAAAPSPKGDGFATSCDVPQITQCLLLLSPLSPAQAADQQLQQATSQVIAIEGSRSHLLLSLYHMHARVLMMRGLHVPALRVMQRCLGLAIHFAQSKRIYHFLSYTRNVVDVIKRISFQERLRARAMAAIQDWILARVLRRRKLLEAAAGPLPALQRMLSNERLQTGSPSSSPSVVTSSFAEPEAFEQAVAPLSVLSLLNLPDCLGGATSHAAMGPHTTDTTTSAGPSPRASSATVLTGTNNRSPTTSYRRPASFDQKAATSPESPSENYVGSVATTGNISTEASGSFTGQASLPPKRNSGAAENSGMELFGMNMLATELSISPDNPTDPTTGGRSAGPPPPSFRAGATFTSLSRAYDVFDANPIQLWAIPTWPPPSGGGTMGASSSKLLLPRGADTNNNSRSN